MKYAIFFAASALSVPAHAALIAAWNQDEVSGNILDSTGGHAPGALVTGGSVIYGQPGVPNGTYGSIVVTGATGTSIGYGPNLSDDYFISGASNANPVMNIPRTGSLTVMAWINPNAPDVAGRAYRAVSTGSSAGTDRGWGFGLRFPDTLGNATVRFTNYGVLDNDSDPFVLTFGQWVHVAATYSNGTITYYMNGNLLTGGDTSLFGDDLAAARLTVGGRLGSAVDGSLGNDFDQTNGLLDGVQVYDAVLTPAEIRTAALAGIAVPEPTVTGTLLLVAGLAGVRRRR